MKNLFIALACLIALSSCGPQGQWNDNSNVVITQEATNLGANLDLQALGELVKTSTNAQDIESKLNSTGSINNLDLDGDGKVDYINVTEYGTGTTKGFSFTVDLGDKGKQEIATIEIEKGVNTANMNIQGNQQVYGQSAYYQSNYNMTDLLIMSYLFSYHSPYYSPYRYGYYPSYYHSYGCVPMTSYRSRVTTTTRTSTIRKTTNGSSKISSPNSSFTSKTVSTRAQSLANPTRSQRSFSSTSNSRPSTGDFGNKTASSRSSSYSSSSRSSSSRSFGSSSRSSGRSFGGSRRSDIRFKTNITPLDNSLNKICSLNGVSYDWRIKEFPSENFEAKRQLGLIAQQVEVVYPTIVTTRKDGYKTVDYQMLIPALIESVKELRATNMKQDSIINVLLNRNEIVKK